MTEAHSPRGSTGIRLDSTAIKVLAHPLRSRLLSALRRDGAATATDLAGALGTNSGATSYHLRKLESVGLVRDTGEGEGKRRLWEASTRSHSWDPSQFADDEDARTAMGWLTRDYVHQHAALHERWIEVSEDWSPQWQDACGSSDDSLLLTAELAQRLAGDVQALFDRYREAGAGHPDAERVFVWFVSNPQDLDRPREP